MRCKRVSAVPATVDAPDWSRSERLSVDMTQTPLVMQPTEYIQNKWTDKPYGRITPLEVQALHDGHNLAVRISWTPLGGGNPDFPDGVAFAMPLKGEPPLMSMGTDDEPMHILVWQASRTGDEKLRSVEARGIGSSAPGPKISTKLTLHREKDRIQVAMTRPIGPKAPGALVRPGKISKIGFAVWDGGNEERGGIKAFSIDWIDLVLDV